MYFLVQSKTPALMLFLQSYPGKSKWDRKLGMSWTSRTVRARSTEAHLTRFCVRLCLISFSLRMFPLPHRQQASTAKVCTAALTDSVCSRAHCCVLSYCITRVCEMCNTWDVFMKAAFERKDGKLYVVQNHFVLGSSALLSGSVLMTLFLMVIFYLLLDFIWTFLLCFFSY